MEVMIVSSIWKLQKSDLDPEWVISLFPSKEQAQTQPEAY